MKIFRTISPEWVHTGAGSLSQLPRVLSTLEAKRVFLLTTQSLRNQVGEIESLLGQNHTKTFSHCKQHSPADTVDEALAVIGDADAIISFGGGSVIDTAKAVAARAGHPPQIAIPTTLSAGEFTPGIGITDQSRRVKDVSVDLKAVPRVVIHDPKVARLTPQQLWLSSGVKALDHAIEMLWWHESHPKTTLTATDAAARLLEWLPQSNAPDATAAREHCFLGAWMSIEALFSAGARLSHPVGHQLGAFWNIPHGVTSCIALPASMRALDSITPAVSERVAPLFGEKDGASAADALTRWLEDMDLPTRLRDTQALRSEIPQVAEAVTQEFKSMKRQAEVDVNQLLETMW